MEEKIAVEEDSALALKCELAVCASTPLFASLLLTVADALVSRGFKSDTDLQEWSLN
ncbi:hypothetical protein L798_13858 [Zootermopsis nevadensis]|uniref:Uncharacterized protein n=1 Tax=Zootermopsis nevadensis TaxID=136037 RepID=A0A067QRI6_ZOONE|nr:hypothetical protein L798_13858 [Zootermopsis nevadensis]